MKTLYVHRPLLNGQDIKDWAKRQGIEKTLAPEDMHVTIAFSRAEVDWNKFVPEKDNMSSLHKQFQRSVERLGDKGAVVLKFQSTTLSNRWAEFMSGGCSWDWPSYQPHVTITYDGAGLKLSDIHPYYGYLWFGPESFNEVVEDWDEKIVET